MVQEVAGMCRSGVTVAQMMRSISWGGTPDISSAFRAASVAYWEKAFVVAGNPPFLDSGAGGDPLVGGVHIFSSSLLVRIREGREDPVPVTTARSLDSPMEEEPGDAVACSLMLSPTGARGLPCGFRPGSAG